MGFLTEMQLSFLHETHSNQKEAMTVVVLRKVLFSIYKRPGVTSLTQAFIVQPQHRSLSANGHNGTGFSGR